MDKKQEPSEGNFFSRIFGSLFGSHDPESEKKRKLKAIAKALGKSKYKFYKYSTDEVLPSMAKFFYDLYKIVGPGQVMFQNIQNPNALKNATIDFSLNQKQTEIMDKLDETYILELAKNHPLQEVSDKVKSEITAFSAEFDIDKMNSIDNLYSKLMTFKSFCTFDYYFLLKKFDSNLHEHDFNYLPRFDTIRAEYIKDDLKDFTSLAWALPLNENWTDVMSLLRKMKGLEPIAIGNWNKVINRLRDLRDNNVFEMIIQLITKDPTYTTVVSQKTERICEPHIEKLKTQAQSVLQKIQHEKTSSQIDELLNFIFGTSVVVRLKNYSENQNVAFQKKMLPGFLYTAPLNYLKAFLLDFFKKEAREFADLVLVRGKWSTAAMANQFSETYHLILSISDQITEFDDSLAEDKETGMKLKTMLLRCDRDKEAGRIIRSQLKDINDNAMEMMTVCSQQLVAYGRVLKNLLEDHDKPHAEMIINWKELDHHSDNSVRESGVFIYKMIYRFVTLMQFFLKKKEE